MNNFMERRIYFADNYISKFMFKERISEGDVVLTYGWWVDLG